ncbi:MAG TPA: hypothetical protein VMJ10_29665 [Kofleriaceae bacterium]|nr:hypothetical protein [Kofleriaceae bacterium]
MESRIEIVPDGPREWVAGIVDLPGYVMEGDAPYRPEVLLWVDVASGMVLNAEIARPGESLATAAEQLERALARPLRGAPTRAPSRIRCATLELANALRGVVPSIEVVVAPVPELHAVAAALADHLGATQRSVDTYFDPGITAELLSAFFAASARLYRARPWDAVPPDVAMSLDCDALGITNGMVCVVGQMGQSYGFAVYPDEAAWEATLDLADDGMPKRIPPQIMFNWDTRGDIGAARAKEVKKHRWELAGPRAYPSALRLEGGRGARPLTAVELAALTAIATALAELVERTPDLAEVWHRAAPIEHRTAVAIRGATIAVTLVAPARLANRIAHAPREPDLANVLHGPLLDDDGELDETRCGECVAKTCEAFARSPEATGCDLRWSETFVELAASHHAATVGKLSAVELQEIVFGLFPAKVPAQPEDAAAIVATVRAVLAFVARETGGDAPNRCLASLKADAHEQLARRLADPTNFGPAKALFAAGAAAGYDMTTEAGISEWVRVVNQQAAPRTKSPSRRRTKAKAKSPKRTTRKKPRR